MKTRFAQLGITVFCFLSYLAVALFGCSSTQPVSIHTSVPSQTVPAKVQPTVQLTTDTQAIPYEDMLYPGAKEWLRQLKKELNVHAWYISGFCLKKSELSMQSKSRKARSGKWETESPQNDS